MLGILIVLLLAWLALVIVGLAIKAVFWLAIVGVVLFLATAAFGAVHHTMKPRP